jgi:hypothetical protein
MELEFEDSVRKANKFMKEFSRDFKCLFNEKEKGGKKQ